MILLKYRCGYCSKVFWTENSEQHTNLACPHCSNSFEGVHVAWVDDEMQIYPISGSEAGEEITAPLEILVASIDLFAPDPRIAEAQAKLIERIVKSIPEDMRVVMAAGCEVEHRLEGNKYSLRTRNPIAISRFIPGQILVGEKIGEKIKTTTIKI